MSELFEPMKTHNFIIYWEVVVCSTWVYKTKGNISDIISKYSKHTGR